MRAEKANKTSKSQTNVINSIKKLVHCLIQRHHFEQLVGAAELRCTSPFKTFVLFPGVRPHIAIAAKSFLVPPFKSFIDLHLLRDSLNLNLNQDIFTLYM